jgi:hypothetical protein
MKFEKENALVIKQMWNQGAPLTAIAEHLNKAGVRTVTGLPINNQHISTFCLKHGMRRVKSKKAAHRRNKKRAEKALASAAVRNMPAQAPAHQTKATNELAQHLMKLNISNEDKLTLIKAAYGLRI